MFPAIFGTVFMGDPDGHHSDAPRGGGGGLPARVRGQNSLTKIIRIAVINLAGVPSIVYGVFGLGFFVYTLGFAGPTLLPEALPSPTFWLPGVIWSALTLAIPDPAGGDRLPPKRAGPDPQSTIRQGLAGPGATQAETLWRIVLPMASPAIATGLILAIARAAGEVAPRCWWGGETGADPLPMDGNFPYLHVERKFMHLGFHIYDVGFQSPNVEAARPLVYATSFLLVTVIVGLNLTAVSASVTTCARNSGLWSIDDEAESGYSHLRETFRSLVH